MESAYLPDGKKFDEEILRKQVIQLCEKTGDWNPYYILNHKHLAAA
jgi:hypothetical protein